MRLLDYFDRISIIHLTDRKDRYRALVKELRQLRIEITHNKVRVPEAPKLVEANGFPSPGVFGNFLSHLEILKSAQQEGLQSVWVLEDDAIFSKRFIREDHQLAAFLANNYWDMCHFGHSLTKELDDLEIGLPR